MSQHTNEDGTPLDVVESLFSREHVDTAYNMLSAQERSFDPNKMNAMYKIVTGALSIVTSVVSPPLELLIFFLPDLVQMITGPLKQRQREQELQAMVREELIPGVISQLSPKVAESLDELQRQMAEKLNEQFADEIEAKRAAIAGLCEQEKQQETERAAAASEIDRDIREIRAAFTAAGI